MTNHIYTPSSEELDSRIARFENLRQMSTFKDLEWIGQEAMDVMFARKLMPVMLDDTKNPFGNIAPIIGAAGTTMFVSIMPPGQGTLPPFPQLNLRNLYGAGRHDRILHRRSHRASGNLG
jgi:hypothetical protein